MVPARFSIVLAQTCLVQATVAGNSQRLTFIYMYSADLRVHSFFLHSIFHDLPPPPLPTPLLPATTTLEHSSCTLSFTIYPSPSSLPRLYYPPPQPASNPA